MGNTKKVGSSGRYGSRYGVGVKKRVLAVEKRMAKKIPCPFCGFSKTKRTAPGLYLCMKCGANFTGGAYEPQTLIGKTINKMVSQKQFLAGAQELAKVQESSFSDIEREVEKALTSGAPSNAPVAEEKKSKKKKAKEAKEEVIVDEVEDEEVKEVESKEEEQ